MKNVSDRICNNKQIIQKRYTLNTSLKKLNSKYLVINNVLNAGGISNIVNQI